VFFFFLGHDVLEFGNSKVEGEVLQITLHYDEGHG